MTTISSTYANPASTSLQDYSGIQLDRATDQDGDDKSASIEAAHHHHRGGGHMHDAVRQALSSLGLSASAAAGAPSQPTSSGQDGDADDQNAAGGGIQQDLNHFMHALFQSLRQEAKSASATGASSSDTATSSGLTGLITDVSKGNAPTDLQNAFDKLVGDMQSASSGQGSDAALPTGSTTITLQDFLNKLQANLGYGGSGGNASGGILSAVA